jgi:glycosyltransferase involved in cell wall biosynthesis
MKIIYVTQDTGLWGGIYVVFQHLQLLAEAGHDAFLTTPATGPDWYRLTVPVYRVSELTPDLIPEADIVVATSWTTIRPVVESRKGIPVHLCQGLEYDYKELAPHKEAIRAAYSYPIPRLTVAPHLTSALKAQFDGEPYYVGQMVDRNIFYPRQGRGTKPPDRPFTILVVGPFQADFKNIGTALKGIRLARERLERPVGLVRVSQFPLTEEEKEIIAPDAYHFYVPYHEMGRFYREADLFVSMSKEAEGFGLPAVEAMSCGVPAILSRITSYTSFDPTPDYARFVEPMDVQGLADSIVTTVRNPSLQEGLIRGGLRVAATFAKERLQERLNSALVSIRRQDPSLSSQQ